MAEPVSPREWGRQQAQDSPLWSEEKWRRVGAILGVEFVGEQEPAETGPRGAA
jgi:hypothetical protein